MLAYSEHIEQSANWVAWLNSGKTLLDMFLCAQTHRLLLQPAFEVSQTADVSFERACLGLREVLRIAACNEQKASAKRLRLGGQHSYQPILLRG